MTHECTTFLNDNSEKEMTSYPVMFLDSPKLFFVGLMFLYIGKGGVGQHIFYFTKEIQLV